MGVECADIIVRGWHREETVQEPWALWAFTHYPFLLGEEVALGRSPAKFRERLWFFSLCLKVTSSIGISI